MSCLKQCSLRSFGVAATARQLSGTGVEWPRTLALVATRRTGIEGHPAGDASLNEVGQPQSSRIQNFHMDDTSSHEISGMDSYNLVLADLGICAIFGSIRMVFTWFDRCLETQTLILNSRKKVDELSMGFTSSKLS